MPIKSGTFGDPPRTARRDYFVVLVLLLWRMRKDLLLLAVVGTLILSETVPTNWQQSDNVVSIMGITVSIFIGFRNTQAMSRWWEARQLWGAIVNHSRNWSDILTSLLPEEHLADTHGRNLVRYQVAMVWQLNFQLRNFYHQDLRRFQDYLLENLEMKPTTTLRQLGQARAIAVRKLYENKSINARGREQLMNIANATVDAIGGLERIRNTPLPASYDVFVRMLSWIFGFQLLLNFKTDGTPVGGSITGIVLFLGFLMAERIGAYVEGPFDGDGSTFALPLNAICLTISRDLLGNETDSCLHHFSKDPVRWT
jgi:putative membrane protein